MSHLVLFNYEIFNLMLHCVCVCMRACMLSEFSLHCRGTMVTNLQPNSKWNWKN